MDYVNLFLISLFCTGLIVRVLTHILHKPKQYNKHTFTGYLRKRTGLEIHHIHLGFILLCFNLIISLGFNLLNDIVIILYGISLSLIADQIFPLLKLCDYFERNGVLLSIFNHLIIGVIVIIGNLIL